MKIFLLFLMILSTSLISAQNSKIKVYFTKPVNSPITSILPGITVSNMDDTIVSYIDKAVTTLDIAVYDNGSSKIVTAINNAYYRGVIVRYISTAITLNTALIGLDWHIPVLKRLGTDVMHNKFVIINASSTTNSYLLTGSMNYTSSNMFDDYNNFVIIQDKALAQAYTTEFEEMWGGSSSNFNLISSRFGAQKMDNTPHSFNINGTNVELYFSPSDATSNHINDALLSCNHTAKFAMFTFIDNTLGNTMINLHNAGKEVNGIIENINFIGSEYQALKASGIDVLAHDMIPNSFHHKYAVVDASNADSDPLVITGSHNWTNSAENNNDENTLIIHDQYVASQYSDEFQTRFNDILFYDIEDVQSNIDINVFPNPTNKSIQWTSKNNLMKLISITTIFGEKIKNVNFNTLSNNVDISTLPNGIYVATFYNETNYFYIKIVKQ